VSGQDDRQTDAAALVQRAYALSSAEESKALYRDWATSYDQSMLDGLGYLTPTLTAELLTRHLDARDAAILDIGSGTGLAGVALQPDSPVLRSRPQALPNLMHWISPGRCSKLLLRETFTSV